MHVFSIKVNIFHKLFSSILDILMTEMRKGLSFLVVCVYVHLRFLGEGINTNPVGHVVIGILRYLKGPHLQYRILRDFY